MKNAGVFPEPHVAEHPQLAATQTEPLLASLDGVKALVVDDEADARELVALVLRASDAAVLTASSANEAAEIISREALDVLISDIGLPAVDGHELIQRVRGNAGSNAGLLAIALTAYAREQDRIEALEAGFQTHVAKPVEPAKLVRVTLELARRTRGQR